MTFASASRGEDPPALKVEVAETAKAGTVFRIALPKGAKAGDRVVFVLVDDKTVKDPASLILIPEGQVEKAVKSLKEIVEKFGGGLIVHQVNSFNNGTFTCCAASNSHKKLGVIAWCEVLREKTHRGTCFTYFNIEDWGTDKKDVIELPVPPKPNEARTPPLPPKCSLTIWVIDMEGKKLAIGKVDLK